MPDTKADTGKAPGTRIGLPAAAVVGLLVGLLLFVSTQPRIRDVDLFWHLRAGRELLDGVALDSLGSAWSMAPHPLPWITTQWLSEVGLSLIHQVGGWEALVVYRTITAALTVSILAWTTLRGRPRLLAGFPFLLAAVAAVSVSQERPNQATLVGAAALGGLVVPALAQGRTPRWWLLLPATWLWANLHGGWVLVPVLLAILAVGRLLDHGWRDRPVRRLALLALLTTVCGSLTPAGTSSTLGFARLSGAAADHIQEWERTAPLSGIGVLCTGMVLLIAVGWARTRVPWSEALAAGALVLFAWSALRNVAPALLILAPLVAQRLSLAFPSIGRDPEPRWSAPLGVGIALALTAAGLATLPNRDLLPDDVFPVGLAQRIGDLPGDQRVLNDYNTSGLVLFFGAEGDRVGVDGRTDRYGADYIRQYLELQDVQGDWEPLLDELDPTVALLRSDEALAHVLSEERGWVELGREGDWVLLAPPPGAA